MLAYHNLGAKKIYYAMSVQYAKHVVTQVQHIEYFIVTTVQLLEMVRYYESALYYLTINANIDNQLFSKNKDLIFTVCENNYFSVNNDCINVVSVVTSYLKVINFNRISMC